MDFLEYTANLTHSPVKQYENLGFNNEMRPIYYHTDSTIISKWHFIYFAAQLKAEITILVSLLLILPVKTFINISFE